MSTFRKGSLLVALVAIVSLVTAVSAFARASATTAVAVTAGKPGEFNFTVSKKVLKKGTTGVFKVVNRGGIKHDFKIAGKRTPQLATGKTATLSIFFKKAGKYPYLCTLPGHAAGGMKGVITVK